MLKRITKSILIDIAIPWVISSFTIAIFLTFIFKLNLGLFFLFVVWPVSFCIFLSVCVKRNPYIKSPKPYLQKQIKTTAVNRKELINKSKIELPPKKETRFIKFCITFAWLFIIYSLYVIAFWSSITPSLPSGTSLYEVILDMGFYALFGGIIAILLPTSKKIIYIPVSLTITKILSILLTQSGVV